MRYYILNISAIRKCRRFYAFEAGREFDAGKPSAAIECINTYACETCRKFDAGKPSAAFESRTINACDCFRDGRSIATSVKHVCCRYYNSIAIFT